MRWDTKATPPEHAGAPAKTPGQSNWAELRDAQAEAVARDAHAGLAVTLDHFRTREQQHRALDILQFKLDILWTMLDAIEKGFPR